MAITSTRSEGLATPTPWDAHEELAVLCVDACTGRGAAWSDQAVLTRKMAAAARTLVAHPSLIKSLSAEEDGLPALLRKVDDTPHAELLRGAMACAEAELSPPALGGLLALLALGGAIAVKACTALSGTDGLLLMALATICCALIFRVLHTAMLTRERRAALSMLLEKHAAAVARHTAPAGGADAPRGRAGSDSGPRDGERPSARDGERPSARDGSHADEAIPQAIAAAAAALHQRAEGLTPEATLAAAQQELSRAFGASGAAPAGDDRRAADALLIDEVVARLAELRARRAEGRLAHTEGLLDWEVIDAVVDAGARPSRASDESAAAPAADEVAAAPGGPSDGAGAVACAGRH